MKRKCYECCIFDLDGTLLDTSAGLLSSLDHTIEQCGLPPFPEEKRHTVIGPPIKVSLQRQYGLPEREAEAALRVFREHYESKELFSAVPYPGIRSLLSDLRARGIKLALGTYKVKRYAEAILSHFRMRGVFDFVGGADPEGKLNKTDILKQCVDALCGGEPDKALMIGDSEFDARGAMEAGIDFLAVTYGFGFRTERDAAPYPCVGICDTVRKVGDFCGLYGE